MSIYLLYLFNISFAFLPWLNMCVSCNDKINWKHLILLYFVKKSIFLETITVLNSVLSNIDCNLLTWTYLLLSNVPSSTSPLIIILYSLGNSRDKYAKRLKQLRNYGLKVVVYDKMIDRCKSYIDAGAEIIFPEALEDEKDFEKVRKNLSCYLLANM